MLVPDGVNTIALVLQAIGGLVDILGVLFLSSDAGITWGWASPRRWLPLGVTKRFPWLRPEVEAKTAQRDIETSASIGLPVERARKESVEARLNALSADVERIRQEVSDVRQRVGQVEAALATQPEEARQIAGEVLREERIRQLPFK